MNVSINIPAPWIRHGIYMCSPYIFQDSNFSMCPVSMGELEAGHDFFKLAVQIYKVTGYLVSCSFYYHKLYNVSFINQQTSSKIQYDCRFYVSSTYDLTISNINMSFGINVPRWLLVLPNQASHRIPAALQQFQVMRMGERYGFQAPGLVG